MDTLISVIIIFIGLNTFNYVDSQYYHWYDYNFQCSSSREHDLKYVHSLMDPNDCVYTGTKQYGPYQYWEPYYYNPVTYEYYYADYYKYRYEHLDFCNDICWQVYIC